MYRLIVALLLFMSNGLIGQNYYKTQTSMSDAPLNTNRIMELPVKIGELEGSVYLSDSWEEYEITLVSEEVITGIVCKYDIEHNSFDIKHNDEIKTLPGNMIRHFNRIIVGVNGKVKNSYYNVRSFNVESNELSKTGFLEELYSGKRSEIYKYYFIKHIKPTYNAALDTGDKSERLVIQNEILVHKDEAFVKLESNKKKNLMLFGDERSDVANYIKQNKLSFKDDEHVKMIFTFFDKL